MIILLLTLVVVTLIGIIRLENKVSELQQIVKRLQDKTD